MPQCEKISGVKNLYDVVFQILSERHSHFTKDGVAKLD